MSGRARSSAPSRVGSLLVGWALHAGVAAGAAAAVRIERRTRGRVPLEVPVGTTVAIAAYWSALEVLERRRPFRPAWRQPVDGDTGTDLAFLAVILPVSLSVQALGASIARRLPRRANLSRLPTPVAVALTVLAYDLAHSQLHRLGHEWGPGWKVHSVHHSPKRLYWFNATRFHTVETVIDGLVDGFVAGAAGLSDDQEVAYLTVRALYGQLQHCNVELRSGLLDRVFSTPDLHRWHHSTDYDEGDTNYGAVTSVWDQVFGTFFRPARAFDAVVGVGRMPDFPTTFAGLEATPFRWARIRAANAATWTDDRGHAVGT